MVRAVAWLHGLDICSDGQSSSPPPTVFLAVAAAAAARRPRPVGEPAEPSVGMIVGRSGRHLPGGTAPNALLEPPAKQGERVRALNVPKRLLL